MDDWKPFGPLRARYDEPRDRWVIEQYIPGSSFAGEASSIVALCPAGEGCARFFADAANERADRRLTPTPSIA